MVPEAAFAMLACARIGAIHSVVFGGFAPQELATRIDDARPKLIISASCGLEPGRVIAYKPLLDGAIELAGHKPERCLILQRPQQTCELTPGRDLDYAQLPQRARQPARRHACRSRPPTRSTSSTPPARPASPRAWCATMAATWSRSNGSMQNMFGVKPGEVFWAASDVGWVVGHSYIVYAPLLHGCTTILYEGKPVGTPDAGTFWRVIAEHGVVGPVHRADRLPRHQERGPGRRVHREYDLSTLPHPVPGRRARRPRHGEMGRAEARRCR